MFQRTAACAARVHGEDARTEHKGTSDGAGLMAYLGRSEAGTRMKRAKFPCAPSADRLSPRLSHARDTNCGRRSLPPLLRRGIESRPDMPRNIDRPAGQGVERQTLQFIDLFSGCGGFTLGMIRAGFECLASIDFDGIATRTLRENLPEVRHVLQRDLTAYHPEELSELLDGERVDVIVGGPPCQGFSTARQVDGANHGSKLIADPRRNLYRDFLSYVEFFQPRVFVMENVLGLRTAAGGEYFTRVQKEGRELGRSGGKPGYRVHGQIEDAWELGSPQKRRRQLIIGVRNDLHGYFPEELLLPDRAEPRPPLWAAIGDLPQLSAGAGEDECDYDLDRRKHQLCQGPSGAKKYLFEMLEIRPGIKLTNHVARPHSDRDLRDFALLREGENAGEAIRRRGVTFEFPYSKDKFKDRYTRQSRSGPSSTIVAHLKKDGLMFIHPTQRRSLTPREAARVQTFPDWFRFPNARTHSFRLIGNAVPPVVSEAVGLTVKKFLQRCDVHAAASGIARTSGGQLVVRRERAARELLSISGLDKKALRRLPTSDLLRSWRALLSLVPSLHPGNALDHGSKVEIVAGEAVGLRSLDRTLLRRYARSGWPVAFEPLGREVWRRYKAREIDSDMFYLVSGKPLGAPESERPSKRRVNSRAS